jgi:hypothetical protein
MAQLRGVGTHQIPLVIYLYIDHSPLTTYRYSWKCRLGYRTKLR